MGVIHCKLTLCTHLVNPMGVLEEGGKARQCGWGGLGVRDLGCRMVMSMARYDVAVGLDGEGISARPTSARQVIDPGMRPGISSWTSTGVWTRPAKGARQWQMLYRALQTGL